MSQLPADITALDYQLDNYNYHLPESLIAQSPTVPRDRSRLLVVTPAGCEHRVFADLGSALKPHDLLVLNNSKVIPARLLGHKIDPVSATVLKSQIEVLLLEPLTNLDWLALVKPGKRLKPGTQIIFGASSDEPLRAEIVSTDKATHGRVVRFQSKSRRSLMEQIHSHGSMPLPPYIQGSQSEPAQYQTVYAARPGSVAAPTAGLHFTPGLLQRLEEHQIRHVFVTLHVGIGTFRPVESADITAHNMHAEWIQVPQTTAQAIADTKKRGGRVIAVGTTTVRSLESMAQQSTEPAPFEGKSNLFIYPGYRWQIVDGLITNFHLPKSSLLMLVSALIGRQRLLSLYQTAIEEQYRFFSFGDAMLITPEAAKSYVYR